VGAEIEVETCEIEIHLADPLPAMPMGEGATTFDVLLEDTLPDLFGPNANHKCVYRDIAMRYVQEDLQRRSTQQVAGKGTSSIIKCLISLYAKRGYIHIRQNRDPGTMATMAEGTTHGP